MASASLPERKLKKTLAFWRTLADTLGILNMKYNLDLNRIKELEVDGINFKDAPEFTDAYFSAGIYMSEDGKSFRELTERELEWLTSNEPQWLYEKVVARVW